MSNLKGKVAIITGASQGIGQAIAYSLASQGVHLVLSARNQSKLETLAQALQQKHPDIKILTITTDVQAPDQVEQLVQATVERFSRLDILINNAGIAGKIALLQEISIEEINRTIDTNLKGPIYLMKYALPVMVSQQAGTIININSVAGKTAYPYWSLYDASKFGLHAITVAVGEEQRSNGIKVMGIYPGAVDTPIWETIELNHEPNKPGMLSADTVAETVLYALQQPSNTWIPEITISPLQAVL